jgi:Carboxypeptidase regulatory-like domain
MNLLAAAAYFSLNFFPMDQAAVQSDVMVRGTVVGVASNHAIPGVAVDAVSDTSVERTTTDASGHFYFMSLLPGNYQFYASAPGYEASCTPGTPSNLAYELDAGFEYAAMVYLSRACY